MISSSEHETSNQDYDPRLGEYLHPSRGKLVTYFLENQRNTRLYFDEQQGSWARMPLRWEIDLEDVGQALQQLDEAFPAWANVTEQLLVLRECNYDVQDALAFVHMNYDFPTVQDSSNQQMAATSPKKLDPKAHAKKRKSRDNIVDQSPGGDVKKEAKTPNEAGEKSRGGAPAANANYSLAAARERRALELKLAEQEQTIAALRRQVEDQNHLSVREMTRQHTLLEGLSQRTERAQMDAKVWEKEGGHCWLNKRILSSRQTSNPLVCLHFLLLFCGNGIRSGHWIWRSKMPSCATKLPN